MSCVANNTCTQEDILRSLDELEVQVRTLYEETAEGMDTSWILVSTFLVIFMQAGFAMLEVGAVRSKNIRSILLKNILDFAAGSIGFWATGYAFAYGADQGGFIGGDLFFLHRPPSSTTDPVNLAHFCFVLPFAATGATIVSGAMAERTRLLSYLFISSFLGAFVLPVVMHWVWSQEGIFSAVADTRLFGVGVVDFAGSGVVHMVGGLTALIGAYMLGPRVDEKGVPRFHPACRANDFAGHNVTFTALGMFILWFGWYGFNAGSTLAIVGQQATVGRVVLTTTISGSSASALTFLYESKGQHFDMAVCLNGLLAGLVSITAGCAVVDAWAAFIIGLVGAMVYIGSSRLLVKIGVDDPLEACTLHGVCGSWGMLACALFADSNHLQIVYPGWGESHYGLFLGGGGRMLGAQMVAIMVILLWTAVTTWLMFYIIMRGPFLLRLTQTKNCLRVPFTEELKGLDICYHDGWQFPPYLWPLVENLEALKAVQDQIASESTHFGPHEANMNSPTLDPAKLTNRNLSITDSSVHSNPERPSDADLGKLIVEEVRHA